MTPAGHKRGRASACMIAAARACLLGWLALLATAGCSKKPPDSGQAKPGTEGAAPDDYLATGAAKGRLNSAPALPPLPKPTGPLPPGAACITTQCHAAYLSSPQVHGPVAARACDVCHQDDVGGHKYPLKRNGTDTCTFCHMVSGTASYQHAAISQQGCLSCHRPHESSVKFLLKAPSTEALCATCHRVPLKKHAHGFFIRGDCTICHQPHQADNKFLLRGGEGSRHCFMCHDDVRRLIADAPIVHEPLKGQCTACHSPHATDYEYQLKAPLDQSCLACHDKVKKHLEQAAFTHAAVEQKNRCANCHAAHASTQANLLRRRQDKVCLECHDEPLKANDGRTIPNMKSQLVDAKYRHGPVRAGDCSPCHDAHGSDRPMLLRAAFPKTFYAPFDVDNYALCFGCHSPQIVLDAWTTNLTSFRNGDLNLHYLHVRGGDKQRTCKACHAIHGSNLPKHMASEVPFEGSKWAMPIGFEKTDDGGRCAPGCHEALSYGRDHPAKRPTTTTTKGAQ